jgi:hypothetical protein
MPRSTLADQMKANAAARHTEIRLGNMSDSEETPTSSPVPLRSPTTIPEPPELPPMAGPEGIESWNLDQQRIVLTVQHGLDLFGTFNAILEEHQRERRKPEQEPAADPRARAQQIIEALKKYESRYALILRALADWQTRLASLRRYHLTVVPGLAYGGLRTALSESMRRLRHPQNALGSIPPMPTIPAADNEEALESALNLARQVKATLTEYERAPAEFAQSLFGVRDRIEKITKIIRDEDMRLSTEPSRHSLSTVPSIYPVVDVGALVPMGIAERPDTSALGAHDSYWLP